jgi:hypothetical protein
VPEGPELPVGGEALERLALEDGVGAYVVEHPRLEAEEAAVDPAVEARLLVEARDQALAVEARDAELELRPDDGHRREGAVGGVEVELRAEVDVGHAVGVGDAEAGGAEPVSHARDAPSGRGLLPRVDAVDLEALRQAVRRYEVLDQLTLVAEAEDEAPEALLGVDPDDVPQDRAAADLDQRLRDRLGVLTEPRAAAAAKDDDGLVHGGNATRRRPASR